MLDQCGTNVAAMLGQYWTSVGHCWDNVGPVLLTMPCLFSQGAR